MEEIKIVPLSGESYLVHWSLPEPDGAKNSVLSMYGSRVKLFALKYPPHHFQATFTNSPETKSILLSLELDGEASQFTEHGIREVTVYLDISERKQMPETSRGRWGPVSWPYTFSTLYNYTAKCYEINRPNFELLIRLKEPSIDGQKIVLEQFGRLLESSAFADVEFIVKGQPMKAHVAILAAGSPVLAAMFQRDGFSEGHRRKVDIVDTEPVVFNQLLQFLYTGTAPEHRHDSITEPLFLAADKYQIESLKMICEESLIAALNMDNVVRFLILAHLHTTPKLLDSCVTFIAANKKIIWARSDWKQLNKSYPDLFYLVNERMNAD